MTLDKSTYVGNFIQKLLDGEYITDSKANDIQYEETNTMAVAFHMALEKYNYATKYPHNDIYIQAIDAAYAVIIAAFIHGVVIDKNDLRSKLRQTEELLTRSEDDKARLEKDNSELLRKFIDCNQIKETLEEQLLAHSRSQNDRSDET
jgi:hypothetical protein